MTDLLHARDKIGEASHLAECIFMAAGSLDDEADREAIRTVINHLQKVLDDARATLAALAEQRQRAPSPPSAEAEGQA